MHLTETAMPKCISFKILSLGRNDESIRYLKLFEELMEAMDDEKTLNLARAELGALNSLTVSCRFI